RLRHQRQHAPVLEPGQRATEDRLHARGRQPGELRRQDRGHRARREAKLRCHDLESGAHRSPSRSHRRLLPAPSYSRLALFGSVLRDDFMPDSDVDVLVEFEGKTPGFAYFTMQEELSDILGRRADLKTPNELSKYF